MDKNAANLMQMQQNATTPMLLPTGYTTYPLTSCYMPYTNAYTPSFMCMPTAGQLPMPITMQLPTVQYLSNANSAYSIEQNQSQLQSMDGLASNAAHVKGITYKVKYYINSCGNNGQCNENDSQTMMSTTADSSSSSSSCNNSCCDAISTEASSVDVNDKVCSATCKYKNFEKLAKKTCKGRAKQAYSLKKHYVSRATSEKLIQKRDSNDQTMDMLKKTKSVNTMVPFFLELSSVQNFSSQSVSQESKSIQTPTTSETQTDDILESFNMQRYKQQQQPQQETQQPQQETQQPQQEIQQPQLQEPQQQLQQPQQSKRLKRHKNKVRRTNQIERSTETSREETSTESTQTLEDSALNHYNAVIKNINAKRHLFSGAEGDAQIVSQPFETSATADGNFYSTLASSYSIADLNMSNFPNEVAKDEVRASHDTTMLEEIVKTVAYKEASPRRSSPPLRPRPPPPRPSPPQQEIVKQRKEQKIKNKTSKVGGVYQNSKKSSLRCNLKCCCDAATSCTTENKSSSPSPSSSSSSSQSRRCFQCNSPCYQRQRETICPLTLCFVRCNPRRKCYIYGRNAYRSWRYC